MSSKRKKTHYWKCIFFWNPLITIPFLLAFSGLESFGFRFLRSNVIADIVTTTCFTLIWIAVPIERWIRHRLGRPAVRHGSAWYMALSCLAMLPGLWLGFLAGGRFSALVGRPWQAPDLADYRVGILMGLIIAGIFMLYETLKDSREAELQAQLSALSAQMNPHLLFNALNTVASLIPSDPGAAEELTVRLSELYRGVLDASRRSTHTLADELGLCRAYLDIEKARFGERLRTKVEIDASVDPARIEIPVLLLQPLIENAVKHGISSRSNGGEVGISVTRSSEGYSLVVEDDGVGMGNSSSRKGAGSGIANCRARIELRYGAAGMLTIDSRPAGGTRVRIALPAQEVPA